ncbi:hypothetical protein BGZ61DRAFT_438070 [Ilyonectria robusta]|uniref:uncharacterized protein n=1 Tax=Ilyonectria robusta TaxID=1079257 RepID=UPI001E8EDF65|nr:uncharacterized protein BGZ61DRAFT_438070 [Ilyonectria robusta]KAH8737314.1 hypothetical protein BGZ61DRAFT_438070 [Ilyonectria robusta]
MSYWRAEKHTTNSCVSWSTSPDLESTMISIQITVYHGTVLGDSMPSPSGGCEKMESEKRSQARPSQKPRRPEVRVTTEPSAPLSAGVFRCRGSAHRCRSAPRLPNGEGERGEVGRRGTRKGGIVGLWVPAVHQLGPSTVIPTPTCSGGL